MATKPPRPAHPVALAIARATLRVSRLSVGRLARGAVGWWARKLGGERFSVQTEDGVKLDALRIPARTGLPDRLPVVLAHGYCETKEFHVREAAILVAGGHDVILFDMRAHGCSGGPCVTFGVRERDDFKAVIDEAQRRGWVRSRVINFGYSLGAATAIQHAASDPRTAAVVALAPFIDMRRAVRSFRRALVPWMGHRFLLRGMKHATLEAGFAMQEASTRIAIDQIRVPLLIAVGTADVHLPGADHARKLAAQRAEGCCRFLEISGATHLNIYRKRWPGLDEAILEFCAAAQNGKPA